jgi:type IV secretory pathway TraG/TraD family ATPase VirD4
MAANDVIVDEIERARGWLAAWLIAGAILGAGVLILAWPVTDWLEHQMTAAVWWTRTTMFLQLLQDDPLRVVLLYESWWTMGMEALGRPPAAFFVALIPVSLFLEEGFRLCPYDWRRTIHGSARPATMSDLKRWARKRLIPWLIIMKTRRANNLLDTQGIVLGRLDKRLIRSADTLSCLVLAAPGSGKTAGVMMPTILATGMETWSLYLFDIKGELYEDTAGWRSKWGPVFRFEPMGRGGCRWNPLSPEKSLPGGKRYAAALDEMNQMMSTLYMGDPVTPRAHLFALMRDHTDWRRKVVAEPGCLGTPAVALDEIRSAFKAKLADLAVEMSQIGADIEAYLWKLASNMVPAPKGGGGNSEHFANTGREALFGMMGYTVFRAMKQGVEPHFGLMVDWWMADQADRRNGEEGEQGGDGADSISRTLDDWVDQCDAFGYPLRYKQALLNLRSKPDKERGSVVSTADTSLNIFKIATVRDATCTSDFALDDIRGMKGPDGNSYPVTVYVVVSLEQISAMAPILCMFTEALQSRLISQPAKVAKKARKVLFGLDEFAQIPKMEMLLKGPAVGRGMKVSSLLIAQSDGQIEDTYGQGGLKTLYDTTEWKVVFPLTSKQTADNISASIGKTTIRQRSVGTKGFDLGGIIDGMFGKSGVSGGNAASFNDSHQGIALFEASDLMSADDAGKMKADEQLVMVRGRNNRPILAKTPYYFEDKVLSARSKLTPPANEEAKGFCGALRLLAPKKAADDLYGDAGLPAATGGKPMSAAAAEPARSGTSLLGAASRE